MASPLSNNPSILGAVGISTSSLFRNSYFCESTARPNDAQRRNEQ